jgi:hypothetical protein
VLKDRVIDPWWSLKACRFDRAAKQHNVLDPGAVQLNHCDLDRGHFDAKVQLDCDPFLYAAVIPLQEFGRALRQRPISFTRFSACQSLASVGSGWLKPLLTRVMFTNSTAEE